MASNMKRGLPSGASHSLSLPAQVDPESIEQWRNPIELAARKSNVPASVTGGVIYQESSGRDAGLMNLFQSVFQVRLDELYPVACSDVRQSKV
ncbi:unnamed protein product [Adineta ricciae]|uniref:Uncharacterized protein n=1 Tax=Adineta ricciae TaxID=249248 RepID=A0A814YBI0_ADIRI|nr:unnamed protein product [Adineta ricciae]CAF1226816.1 unnamed protein product [Adineta ricciae]